MPTARFQCAINRVFDLRVEVEYSSFRRGIAFQSAINRVFDLRIPHFEVLIFSGLSAHSG